MDWKVVFLLLLACACLVGWGALLVWVSYVIEEKHGARSGWVGVWVVAYLAVSLSLFFGFVSHQLNSHHPTARPLCPEKAP